MLQQPNPDDFVLATGETHQVREFVNKSFNALGMQLKCAPLFCFVSFAVWSLIPRWEGSGVDEHAINIGNGKVVVRVDPAYFRPAEVECVFQFSWDGLLIHGDVISVASC